MNPITRIATRRGVASITAIVMIGLVGVALAGAAAMFSAQSKRTRDEATEAQLRQLLTAGAIAAVDAIDVKLPPELSNDGAKLTIQRKTEGDLATVEMSASLRGREMRQTLRLTRSSEKWNITDAVLGGDQPASSTQPSDRSTAASQRS